MSLSLYDAFVPSCVQILNGMRAQVDKAESYGEENNIAVADWFSARLAGDMWPLPYHVRSVWVHSKLALELAPSGEFTPDFGNIPGDWDAMRAMLDDALAALQRTSVEELEALENERVHLVMGGKRLMEFTVANFLLSFSQPNYYFHAATFYDILRMKGLPLVKRDYLFAPRVIGN